MQTFSLMNVEQIIIDKLACKTSKTRAASANILQWRTCFIKELTMQTASAKSVKGFVTLELLLNQLMLVRTRTHGKQSC